MDARPLKKEAGQKDLRANNGAGTLSKAMQVLHVKHPHGIGCMAVHVETERLLTIESAQVATAPILMMSGFKL